MKKVISHVLAILGGASIGGILSIGWMKRIMGKQPDRVKKFKDYYQMLYQWVLLKQHNRSVQDYFTKHGYQKIAIYGFGEVGKLLYDELADTSVEVLYAIDRWSESIFSEIPVRDADGFFDDVDVIVVSAVFDFDNIAGSLRADCPVISLNDVLLDF